ncbi:MAG: hypothetical protein CSB01_00705, partial [Bacteroidia bacterium]
MKIQQGDILIRMTKSGEQMWISQRLVVDKCKTDNGYLRICRLRNKKSVRPCDLAKSKEFLPDSGKAWRWGKNQNGYYYCYDNIPDRKPTFYRSRLGSKTELKDALKSLKGKFKDNLKQYAKQEIIKNVVGNVQNVDMQYYMYQAPVSFNQKQAAELAEALAWCRYLTETLKDNSYKNLGINKKRDLYGCAVELLATKQLEGMHVKSAAYLRNK